MAPQFIVLEYRTCLTRVASDGNDGNCMPNDLNSSQQVLIPSSLHLILRFFWSKQAKLS